MGGREDTKTERYTLQHFRIIGEKVILDNLSMNTRRRVNDARICWFALPDGSTWEGGAFSRGKVDE